MGLRKSKNLLKKKDIQRLRVAGVLNKESKDILMWGFPTLIDRIQKEAVKKMVQRFATPNLNLINRKIFF